MVFVCDAPQEVDTKFIHELDHRNLLRKSKLTNHQKQIVEFRQRVFISIWLIFNGT